MSCFSSVNQYRREVAQKAKQISKAQPGSWQDFLCELVGPLTKILVAVVLVVIAIVVRQLVG